MTVTKTGIQTKTMTERRVVWRRTLSAAPSRGPEELTGRKSVAEGAGKRWETSWVPEGTTVASCRHRGRPE